MTLFAGGYEKLKIATDNYKKYIDNKEYYEQSYYNNLETLKLWKIDNAINLNSVAYNSCCR